MKPDSIENIAIQIAQNLKNPWWYDLSLSVIYSLVASAIFALFVYLLFRKSFYSRLNKYTESLAGIEKSRQQFRASKDHLNTLHTDLYNIISSELSDSNICPSAQNLIRQKINDSILNIDEGLQHLDHLYATFETLRNIGDELK